MATIGGKRGSKRRREDTLESDGDILVIGQSDDPGTPPSSGHGSKRLSRNMGEKMRRERMNNHMMELASMVPSILNAHKKLDKTSILRLTVNFLHLHSGVLEHAVTGEGGDRRYTSMFNNLNKVLSEQLNGFLLLIDGSGTILYTSNSIQQYMGINVEDVLGQPVSCIVHPDDEDVVWKQLLSAQPPVTAAKNTEYRSADLRLLANVKGQQPHYAKVKITGPLKSKGIAGEKTPMFIGVVQPMDAELGPVEILPNFDVSTTHYISKHTLDGHHIDADSRVSLLTGYLNYELQRLSAYDIIHADDLPFAAHAHLTMLNSKGAEIPITLLRLRTNAGTWVYSHTSSHLVLDMWTKKPQYLISVNTIVSKSVGECALEQQRKVLEKLSLDKLRSVEDPQAVGRTVLEVATELRKSEFSSENPSDQSSGSSPAGALSDSSVASPISINTSPYSDFMLLDSPAEENLSKFQSHSGIASHSVASSNGPSRVFSFNEASCSSVNSSSASSPEYPHNVSMSSSVVNNSRDSSGMPLDSPNWETEARYNGEPKMILSPVNPEAHCRTSSDALNSSCSMSPPFNGLNGPSRDILPEYQDGMMCRHSSLENQSFSSSFQRLYRSDASHNKISSTQTIYPQRSSTQTIYPQRSQDSGIQIESLLIDSHREHSLDTDKWGFPSSLRENFQSLSSIKGAITDSFTENGGTPLGSSGSGEQSIEQHLMMYLSSCGNEPTDAYHGENQ